MTEDVKEQLIKENYSKGAAEIAEIVEENEGRISREELEKEVAQRAHLNSDLIDKILSNLQKNGKIRTMFELTV